MTRYLLIALTILGCNQVVDWPAADTLDDGPDAGEFVWGSQDSQDDTSDAGPVADGGPVDAGPLTDAGD